MRRRARDLRKDRCERGALNNHAIPACDTVWPIVHRKIMARTPARMPYLIFLLGTVFQLLNEELVLFRLLTSLSRKNLTLER